MNSLVCIHTVGGLYPDQGGPSVTVPELCRNLCCDRSRLETSIVTLRSSSERRGELPVIQGVDVLWTTRSSTYSTLQSALNAAKPSPIIMHDHGQWLAINHASAKIARQMRIKRIVSPRGMLSPWSMNHKWWKKRLAWYLYAKRDLKNAKAIHATSELELNELRALGIRQPIILIPNGVNMMDFGGDQSRSSDRPYFLFMSRVHQKKGIDLLLRVWQKINPEGWDLVIAGPDEQGIMERTKLPPNVRYVGAVSGLMKNQLLKDAACFVLPTYSENFGVVVAESLMASVPVITTHGAPWAGLLSNQCGWWIPLSDQTLMDSMQQAMSTPPEDLKCMGERGRVWVSDQFSWPAIGIQMAHAYRWVLGFDKLVPDFIHCT